MNDQSFTDPAVPSCTATSQVALAPDATAPNVPGTSQTFFGDIAQLVKILDQNPEIFQFLRTLLAK